MHADPLIHSLQLDRSTQRKQDLRSATADAVAAWVLDAFRRGDDELLPTVSTTTPNGPGQHVSEWLSNCDAEQERMLFRLVHLSLTGSADAAAVAQELAEYVANDYADLFVASRDE